MVDPTLAAEKEDEASDETDLADELVARLVVEPPRFGYTSSEHPVARIPAPATMAKTIQFHMPTSSDSSRLMHYPVLPTFKLRQHGNPIP